MNDQEVPAGPYCRWARFADIVFSENKGYQRSTTKQIDYETAETRLD